MEVSVATVSLRHCTQISVDLCTENGINGYPQMNLYQDGRMVETFKGSRSRERLVAFVQKHTSIEPLPPVSSAKSHTEDHQITPHPEPSINLNPNGKVLALTPATFKNAAAEGNIFVKFFAPWCVMLKLISSIQTDGYSRCGHCKKLAPVWTKLATGMQHKLTIAEVNCDDHKALCKEQDVEGFPMLFLYSAGGQKTEYTGSRKLEVMKSWADKAVKP